MEAAIVGLAVRVTVSASGRELDDIRIAFGGIAPQAFRATGAKIDPARPVPDRRADQGRRPAAALRQAAPADDVIGLSQLPDWLGARNSRARS